ncbi:armadillo-type protein [Pisolithus thermaeus]|nr:armadillo-type protein [Pisolithus thermaeus]
MPASGTVVIPILLLDKTVEHATVSPNATAQDLVDTLTRLDAVKATALPDVPPSAWALQRIRREKAGRRWGQKELDALDKGFIPSAAPIRSLVSPSEDDVTPRRGPEHEPVSRLVSLHPSLSLELTFARIPEIYDGFKWTVFIGTTTTVEDVINVIVEEFGLIRRMPGSKRGEKINYVLEQSFESSIATPLASSARIIEILQRTTQTSAGDVPTYHFCIPEDWFFGSKPRPSSIQSLSTDAGSCQPGLSTQTDDGNTAKQQKPSTDTSSRVGSPEWRSSMSQSLLMNYLPNWSQPSPAATSVVVASASRKGISEPVLMEQSTGGSFYASSVMISDHGEEWSDADTTELERRLGDLGLKKDAVANIHRQSPEKKRKIVQDLLHSRNQKDTDSSPSVVNNSSSNSSLVSRPMPRLFGDASLFGRRSAFPTWGSETTSLNHDKQSDNLFEDPNLPEQSPSNPVQPQTTGSFFSVLWAKLSGEPIIGTDSGVSARAYVDALRKTRSSSEKLVNSLISLRVHLSTARLEWIENFITEEGINVIGGLLSSLTGKGSARRVLTDTEGMVLLELIRCLRVLLNTQPGFDSILLSSTIVYHLVYFIFHGTPLKSCTLAAEILAAMCMVSFDEGYRSVLPAFSEYRIVHNEVFRFHLLVATLRAPGSLSVEQDTSVTGSAEEEGMWEARIAFMALINAISICPDSLEERIVLRDELSRRGLDEVMLNLRHANPPDSFLTQLNVYAEEKFDDDEEFRNRARRAVQAGDGHFKELEHVLLDNVLKAARALGSAQSVCNILQKLDQVMQGNMDPAFKLDVISIMDDLVGYLVTTDDTDDAWGIFVEHVLASIRKVTGRDVRTWYTADIQLLRDRVEDLTRQVWSRELPGL